MSTYAIPGLAILDFGFETSIASCCCISFG